MPGIKEAKGFFYSLLIIGTLVIIASLYSTVWAAPSQGVSGQSGGSGGDTPTPTVTPTPTITPTFTPRPTATVTPTPTTTPPATAIPVVTGFDMVFSTSTEDVIVAPIENSGLGELVTDDSGNMRFFTAQQQVNIFDDQEGKPVGPVKVNIEVDVLGTPSGSLKVVLFEGSTVDLHTTFTIGAANAGGKITNISFFVKVDATDIAVGNLDNARINVVLPQAWVDANGGPEAIRIMRGSEGTGIEELFLGFTVETLETTIVGRDAEGNYLVSAFSPRGFSTFAVVAFESAPPIAVPLGGALTAFAPGAVTTLTSPDSKIAVTIPSGAPVGAGWLLYTPETQADAPAAPPAGLAFGTAIFSLTGIDASGAVTPSTRFHTPITISVQYTDPDVQAAEGNPTRLVLYKYDTVFEAWTPLTTSANLADKTLQASVSRLSFFALLGQPQPPTPTPTPTATLRPGQATPTGLSTATLLPPTPGDVAPGSGLLIGLLIAAFILIAAGSYYLRQSKQS